MDTCKAVDKRLHHWRRNAKRIELRSISSSENTQSFIENVKRCRESRKYGSFRSKRAIVSCVKN